MSLTDRPWTACGVRPHPVPGEAQIQLAGASGRAVLANGNAWALVTQPESDVADMESFLEHAQMILPVLGFDFTQPKVDVAAAVTSGPAESVSPIFVLSAAGATGRARQIAGDFVLLKGSTARRDGVNTWTSYKALRDQLVADGKLAPSPVDPKMYVAIEDIAFASPSAAATILAARNMNGRQTWKLENTGETYEVGHQTNIVAAV